MRYKAFAPKLRPHLWEHARLGANANDYWKTACRLKLGKIPHHGPGVTASSELR